MTTTFEDNTEVTLTDLNQIAIDLGYTDFSVFSTEKFGVDKLNQITSDLVSSGVLRTGANGSLGCEVFVHSGKAVVSRGVIVFESGAKMRITEPVMLELVPETVIYASYNSITGWVSFEVSQDVPDGDCVLLAEVDADSMIVDRRSACVAKVTLNADIPNTYREITVRLDNVTKENNTFTIDMGTNAYRYIHFQEATRVKPKGTTYKAVIKNDRPFLSEEGVENKELIYMNSTTCSYTFTRNGQYQNVKVTGGEGVFYDGTHTLKFLIM